MEEGTILMGKVWVCVGAEGVYVQDSPSFATNLLYNLGQVISPFYAVASPAVMIILTHFFVKHFPVLGWPDVRDHCNSHLFSSAPVKLAPVLAQLLRAPSLLEENRRNVQGPALGGRWYGATLSYRAFGEDCPIGHSPTLGSQLCRNLAVKLLRLWF